MEIERIVNITMEKATNLVAKKLKEEINITVERARTKVEESAESLKGKMKEAEKEIEKVKDDICFERGFRKFMFWATPILLFVQGIMLAIALFG